MSLYFDTLMVVNVVNTFRALYCVPVVTWNTDIQKSAQSWSDTLAASNQFFHSDSGYGENLAMVGDDSRVTDKTFAVVTSIRMWYNEYSSYNYSSPSFSLQTGHFTQLVWKATTSIGVGVAKNSYNQLIVTMQFGPPGNVRGQFSDNVLLPCKDIPPAYSSPTIRSKRSPPSPSPRLPPKRFKFKPPPLKRRKPRLAHN